MEFIVLDDNKEPIAVQRAPVDGELVIEVQKDNDGNELSRSIKQYRASDYVPAKVIVIDGKVNGQTLVNAAVDDVISFTATFDDDSLNMAGLKVSVVDRQNNLIKYASMDVVSGEGTGSFIVDKPGDYLVNDAGINFHSDQIPFPLKMVAPLVVKVN